MAHGDDLVFESFLKKRKDKMNPCQGNFLQHYPLQSLLVKQILKTNFCFMGWLSERGESSLMLGNKFLWVQYWFRLQNTTFSFFLKKGGDAVYLRGQYHMHTVQAVREFGTLSGDYLFEITMKNGKKKILAAETSKLRAMWIETLWKSMQLIGLYCRRSDLPMTSREALSETALGEKEQSKSLSSSEEDLPSPARTMNSLMPEEILETGPYHAAPHAAFAIYDVPRSWRNNSPAENNLGGRY